MIKTTRRIMDVCVDEAVITGLLREGYSAGGMLETNVGVPVSAKLLDVAYERESRRIILRFSDASFEEVKAGKPVPTLKPVIGLQRKKGKAK